ncbi:MAG TPA: hypothetical protein VNH64_11415 [Parvularculaceae bacterium]|nr:hypothetical protein [Parvularculaceae bacterium]
MIEICFYLRLGGGVGAPPAQLHRIDRNAATTAGLNFSAFLVSGETLSEILKGSHD